MAATRLAVAKTYKLYVGGAFVRPESGTTATLPAPGPTELPVASRKDTRDAIRAAATAQPAWAARTAYNKAQIVYRFAEMLESQLPRLTAAQVASGIPAPQSDLAAAIDDVVWYAGWADKLSTVLGSTNPVAGPYLNVTMVVPTGVVASVVAGSPTSTCLRAAISAIAAALTAGNTLVLVVPGDASAFPVLELAEILACSDVPAGVVNILTGAKPEVAHTLASAQAVNALHLLGVTDAAVATDLERTAAATLKRVLRPGLDPTANSAAAYSFLTAQVETTTVWHSLGA